MIKPQYGVFVTILILVIFLFTGINSIAANSELSGYAWSSNIGWMSLNCAMGGVNGEHICEQSDYKIIESEGNLSGFAWSSNVGWIDFDPEGPFPLNPTGENYSAKTEGGKIIGWVRVCSVFQEECGKGLNKNLKSNSTRGGFTGWILFPDNDDFAVKLNQECAPLDEEGVQCAAWGGGGDSKESAVVGWIDFSLMLAGEGYDVHIYKSGEGSVSVWVNGLEKEECPPSCTLENIASGSSIDLIANPGPDHVFGGWTGICVGKGVECNFNLVEDEKIDVMFDPAFGGNLSCFSASESSINLRYEAFVRREEKTEFSIMRGNESICVFEVDGESVKSGFCQDTGLGINKGYVYTLEAEGKELGIASCKTKYPLPDWREVTPFGKTYNFLASIFNFFKNLLNRLNGV